MSRGGGFWWAVAVMAVLGWVAVLRGELAKGRLEQDIATMQGRLEAREEALQRAQAALDARLPEVTRLDTLWRTRWRTEWDTLRVTDSVTVPVEILVLADTAIATCRGGLSACLEVARLQDAQMEDLRRLVRLGERRAARPWNSAGVSWSPTGGPGVYVDRDLWKFRAGMSLGPDPLTGVRAELRFGVRW